MTEAGKLGIQSHPAGRSTVIPLLTTDGSMSDKDSVSRYIRFILRDEGYFFGLLLLATGLLGLFALSVVSYLEFEDHCQSRDICLDPHQIKV